MTLITNMIHKLTAAFATIKPFSSTIIGLLTIFAPITPIIYSMMFLVFLDFISGIRASIKRDGIEFKFFRVSTWKNIKSKKIGITIDKIVSYLLLILAAFVVDTYLIKVTGLYLTKAVSALFGIREFISLLENAGTILGFNIVAFFIVIFKKGWKAGMEEMLKKKDDK